MSWAHSILFISNVPSIHILKYNFISWFFWIDEMNQFSRVIFCSLNFFWGENFFLMFITISTSINTIYWETLLWDYSYKINFPLISISEFKSSALLIKKININYCGIFDSLKYSVEKYISFTYIIQKYTQKKNILQLLVYAFWRQTILYYIFLYHIKKTTKDERSIDCVAQWYRTGLQMFY